MATYPLAKNYFYSTNLNQNIRRRYCTVDWNKSYNWSSWLLLFILQTKVLIWVPYSILIEIELSSLYCSIHLWRKKKKDLKSFEIIWLTLTFKMKNQELVVLAVCLESILLLILHEKNLQRVILDLKNLMQMLMRTLLSLQSRLNFCAAVEWKSFMERLVDAYFYFLFRQLYYIGLGLS